MMFGWRQSEKITDYFEQNPDQLVVVSDLIIVDSELQEIHDSYFRFEIPKKDGLIM